MANLGFNTAGTINKPSGTATGDLLIIFLQVSKEATVSPGIPTGFTLASPAATRVNSGSCGPSIVVYKWATSSEGTTYTLPSTGGGTLCPIMLAVTGANTTAPIDVAPSWVAGTSGSTTPAAPSVTGSVGELLICGFGILQSAAITWTAPSGMTSQGNSRSGSYNNSALYTQVLTASGTTGTKTATGSASTQQPQSMSVVIGAQPDPATPNKFFAFF